MSVRPEGAPAPKIMAILNVTPDSFSDGGRYTETTMAVEQAKRLVEEGADILDIGAESTRPGFTPISAEVELRRLMPVLDALPAAFGGTTPLPISIDTTKAIVARAALARGATIVNDVWGFQGDPALPDIVAEAGASAVLMHNRRTVDATVDILDDVQRFFDRSLALASKAGVPRERLILDPGIGFGKTAAQQFIVLSNLPRLIEAFGLPILVGVSRKSFLKPLVGDEPMQRLIGTLAANLAAQAAGARIVRVHDVAQHAMAFRVARAIAEARL